MGGLIQTLFGGMAGLLTMVQVGVTVGLISLLVARELLHMAGPRGERMANFAAPAIDALLIGFGAVVAVRLFH
jgi:hypothetical protein